MSKAALWEKGLGKTRSGMMGRIRRIFNSGPRVDEDVLEEMEQILIESDVGVETTMELMERIRDSLSGEAEDAEEAVKQELKSRMLSLLAGRHAPEPQPRERPRVHLVVGVNGSGKTTTIGKLAHRCRESGERVLLAGADTFRAAAGEQLDVWGKRAGADVIRQKTGADPASVAYDALDAAIARDVDVLLVDTAGRLQTKINLMEELKKIRRVLNRRMDSAPHEVLLVLDANTGQNGLSQARLFKEAVGVTALALTKLDGTARGGIVFAIERELGIPVKWAGLGEGLEDLVAFDPAAFIDSLFSETG